MSFQEVFQLLYDGIEMSLSYFINPKKRIYLLYLGSSTLLAYYIYYRSNKSTSFLNYIFHKKIWCSTSSYIDYILIFFNSFIKLLFIAPFLIYGFYLAFHTHEFLLNHFGYPSESLTVFQTLLFYTIALTLLNDFASFLTHYLMHKIPFLWEFHKVHHSATTLNPMTQYRLHPIELCINNIRGIVIFGITTGFFDYLSKHQIDKLTFLGVNVFSFIFLFFGANLRHSHVPFKYPTFLEYIFISPFQHQIHHSNAPIHYNKNMGAKFALWDWLFGTLVLSKSVKKLSFGLGEDDKHFNTFLKNMYHPFVGAFRAVFKRRD